MSKLKNKQGAQNLIQKKTNKITNILQLADNQNITKQFNILNKLKYSDQIKKKKTIINNILRIIEELEFDNTTSKLFTYEFINDDPDKKIYNPIENKIVSIFKNEINTDLKYLKKYQDYSEIKNIKKFNKIIIKYFQNNYLITFSKLSKKYIINDGYPDIDIDKFKELFEFIHETGYTNTSDNFLSNPLNDPIPTFLNFLKNDDENNQLFHKFYINEEIITDTIELEKIQDIYFKIINQFITEIYINNLTTFIDKVNEKVDNNGNKKESAVIQNESENGDKKGESDDNGNNNYILNEIKNKLIQVFENKKEDIEELKTIKDIKEFIQDNLINTENPISGGVNNNDYKKTIKEFFKIFNKITNIEKFRYYNQIKNIYDNYITYGEEQHSFILEVFFKYLSNIKKFDKDYDIYYHNYIPDKHVNLTSTNIEEFLDNVLYHIVKYTKDHDSDFIKKNFYILKCYVKMTKIKAEISNIKIKTQNLIRKASEQVEAVNEEAEKKIKAVNAEAEEKIKEAKEKAETEAKAEVEAKIKEAEEKAKTEAEKAKTEAEAEVTAAKEALEKSNEIITKAREIITKAEEENNKKIEKIKEIYNLDEKIDNELFKYEILFENNRSLLKRLKIQLIRLEKSYDFFDKLSNDDIKEKQKRKINIFLQTIKNTIKEIIKEHENKPSLFNETIEIIDEVKLLNFNNISSISSIISKINNFIDNNLKTKVDKLRDFKLNTSLSYDSIEFENELKSILRSGGFNGGGLKELIGDYLTKDVNFEGEDEDEDNQNNILIEELKKNSKEDKEPIDDKYKAFLNNVEYNKDINNIGIDKLREYIYKIENNEFYSDSKINNQDIILFIIVTYVIRFISLYLILWFIDIDIIKSIETGLGFYIFIYLIIFFIIFSIINISKTPISLKSTFYYFYNKSNNNNSRFFVHIGIIFMIGLIPFIISIKDFENKYSNIYLGQDEKRKLYKVINLISALSWLLLSILAFYL
jgi:hypothetical protein